MQPNGTQPNFPGLPPLPDSIRTNLIMGGGTWSVDEDIHEVVNEINLFLAPDSRDNLWFHADQRPIVFSRKLVETFACAWTAKQGPIEAVTHPEVVRQLNRR